MSRYKRQVTCCWAIGLLFCCQLLIAQQPFHVVYDFGFHQQPAFKIIEIDSSIYTSGIALPKGTIDNERTIYMAHFDKYAEFIGQVILEDEDLGHTSSNNCRDIVHIGDEIFMTNNNLPNVNDASRYLRLTGYSLTADTFRTIYKLEAIPPETRAPNCSALARSQDNKLAHAMSSRIEGQEDVSLFIIDPAQPQVIDSRFDLYSDDFNYFCKELLVTPEHYYLIGYRSSLDLSQYNLFCLKLDSQLNLIDEKYFSDLNYRSTYIDAHLDAENNIIISTNHFVNTANDTKWYALILKLDNKLDIIWQTNFGEQRINYATTVYLDIVASHQQDGSMLVGDRNFSSENRSVAVIGKISSEGDSIFYKHITPLDSYYRLYLYDMVAASDGNYLATGESWPIDSADSVFFEGVIIKFDEYGNICDRYNKSSSTATVADLDLVMYPNPVSDMFYLDVGQPLRSIAIIDPTGQVLMQRDQVRGQTIYYQSVADYPSATYFLRCITTDGSVHTEPFVVNR